MFFCAFAVCVWQFLSALRETPRVTYRLLRFYTILFLIIRPLIRFKNPFRKSGQVVRDILGAVSGISMARFGFVVASVWRTTDPARVNLVRLVRFAIIGLVILLEYKVNATFLPGNAGSPLAHAFIYANALTAVGAAVMGYDVWRRLCCALDAAAGAAGVSASVLGLA